MDTVTCWVPASVPSVQEEVALPSAPVVSEVDESAPPPVVTAKDSATLPTAVPPASLLWATRGFANAAPTVSV